MSITFLGYIIIPLGIILLLFRPRYLLYISVLLCGFSGASVINFDTIGFSVQPSYYTAILWIVSEIFHKHKLKYKMPKSMIAFIMLILISLLMPVIFEGKIYRMDIDSQVTLLKFSTANITQTTYFIFCIVFFVFISDYMKKRPNEVEKIINIYFWGVYIVCLVTIYQIFAFKYNLTFNDIFRNGIHGNIQGTRIYGPCGEASMLAYYLITGLTICWRAKAKIIHRVVCFIMLLVLGIMSYSSTFFVGAIIWIICEAYYILRKHTFSQKQILYGIVFVCFAVLLILIITNVLSESLEKTFDQFVTKLERRNFSGQERSETFRMMSLIGLKYPLFGIGFGSSRSKDLFSTWLANTGVLGMVIVLVFLGNLLMTKSESMKHIKIATILVWACMFISVPEPYNLFVWLFPAILSVQRQGTNTLKVRMKTLKVNKFYILKN